VAFLRREAATGHPMVDLGLFRRPGFSAGISSGLLSYLVMFGVLFAVPFYLERGVGLTSARSGLELMIMPLALGIAAPVAGRLGDRWGPRPFTAGGMALVVAGLTGLAVARPATAGFLGLLVVVGVGLGCFTPLNNATVMGAAPPEQSGVASGVLNMTRGMGTALGLAVTGLVFDVAGGTSSTRADVDRAFAVTAAFLAVVALAAGVVSGLRPAGAVRRVAVPDAG
jgi:MFS family permease